jgi:hypothetical protein
MINIEYLANKVKAEQKASNWNAGLPPMWTRILIFVSTVIVVLMGGGLAFLYFRKPAQGPVSPARVAMTPERIARGKYLFEHVADCGRCHSERDFGRVGGPVVPGRQGCGNVISTFLHGMPGVVVASNITLERKPESAPGRTAKRFRAIREGVDKDGNAFPMMPYTDYRFMSDLDVEAVVAYMDSLPLFDTHCPKPAWTFR